MTELQSPTIFSSDGVAAALMGSINLESLFVVLQSVATAAGGADTAIRTDLGNQITALQNQVAEAIKKADKLEDYEKGQIETILQSLISSEGFQTLIQQAVIVVNGETVSMSSALQGILTAPKPTGVELAWGGNGEMMGATVSLSDGTAAWMPMVMTVGDEGEPTEYKIATFSADNFAGKGFPAQFAVHLNPVKRSVGALGIGDVVIGYKIKHYSNVVFTFNASTGALANIVVPDANGDGVIGTPAADAGTTSGDTGNASEFNIP